MVLHNSKNYESDKNQILKDQELLEILKSNMSVDIQKDKDCEKLIKELVENVLTNSRIITMNLNETSATQKVYLDTIFSSHARLLTPYEEEEQ